MLEHSPIVTCWKKEAKVCVLRKNGFTSQMSATGKWVKVLIELNNRKTMGLVKKAMEDILVCGSTRSNNFWRLILMERSQTRTSTLMKQLPMVLQCKEAFWAERVVKKPKISFSRMCLPTRLELKLLVEWWLSKILKNTVILTKKSNGYLSNWNNLWSWHKWHHECENRIQRYREIRKDQYNVEEGFKLGFHGTH